MYDNISLKTPDQYTRTVAEAINYVVAEIARLDPGESLVIRRGTGNNEQLLFFVSNGKGEVRGEGGE